MVVYYIVPYSCVFGGDANDTQQQQHSCFVTTIYNANGTILYHAFWDGIDPMMDRFIQFDLILWGGNDAMIDSIRFNSIQFVIHLIANPQTISLLFALHYGTFQPRF